MFLDDANDNDDDFESIPRVRYSHWKQHPIFLVLFEVWRTVLFNIEIYKTKWIISFISHQRIFNHYKIDTDEIPISDNSKCEDTFN